MTRISTVLAIDPGPTQSAFVAWDGTLVAAKGIRSNDDLLSDLIMYPYERKPLMVVEQVTSYGMAVGKTVFETVFWTGRFCQAWQAKHNDPDITAFVRVPRMEVKMHWCHNSRAKDANIVRAIKDRFGEIGTVKQPNPVYGEDGTKDGKMKADMWQAFALAVYWFDNNGAK